MNKSSRNNADPDFVKDCDDLGIDHRANKILARYARIMLGRTSKAWQVAVHRSRKKHGDPRPYGIPLYKGNDGYNYVMRNDFLRVYNKS